MISKFKVNNVTCYKLTSLQAIEIFNGLGICDDCCDACYIGYYIPILNGFYCENCFEDYKKRAIWYQEDEWFENRNINNFEKICKSLGYKIKEE